MRRFSALFSRFMVFVMLIGQIGFIVPAAHADDSSAPPEADGWVKVSTVGQLVYMNQNQSDYVAKNIQLMNDIDLSGYTWTPLGGNEYPAFSGTFDGRGHVVSGITIQDSPLENVGFIGMASGTIKNVGVIVDIEGGIITGGLVGRLEGGEIERVWSSGIVKGWNGPDIISSTITGGLVGASLEASISRSYSSANVTSGLSSNMYSGGLAGELARSSISDSYSTGSVTNRIASGHYILSGALAGIFSRTNGTNTYTTGHVDTSQTSGAYYALFGGFGGDDMFNNSVFQDSFFDTVTTGQSQDIASGDLSGVTGLTSGQMRLQETYVDANWDFAGKWVIDPGVNNGYPYFRPEILTSDLPTATKDAAYSVQLDAFDGAGGGLSWSASGLPPGISLSASGTLSGTPETPGTFNINITATDAGSADSAKTLQLTVREAAPDVASFSVEPGHAFGSSKATATVGQPHHTFAYTVGESASVRPLVGDPLPDDAVDYTLGADIPDVSAGQYLSVYEIDENEQIQAWSTVLLEASHIQATKHVTGVSVEPAELELVVGQAPQQLTATVEPADATNPAVSWISDRLDVATVDGNSEVTPVAPGTATITVTTEDGAFEASATVTVQPAPPTVGTVTGSVYGDGNAPLAGATVSVDEGAISAVTDGDGGFTLLDVPAGSRTVAVSASGYIAKEVEVTVVAGDTSDIGRLVLTAADNGNDDDDHSSDDSSDDSDENNGGGNGGVSSPPAPSGDMLVRINGKAERVTVVKDKKSDGRTVSRLLISSSLANAMYQNNRTAVIDFQDTDPVIEVELSAAALQEILSDQPDATLRIEANGASYSLPLRIWRDVSGDADITVAIAIPTDAVRQQLHASLTNQGYRLLGNPADFSVYADGREMTSFGGVYTERTIALDSRIDPGTSTVVWVDADDRPHFVPSIFRTAFGETVAEFYAPHNSIYAVIQSERTFADLEGHWAQDDIHLLANKLIVQGTSDDMFAPDKLVSRAEFAAMLARSLGLAGEGDASFTDVRPSDWYADAVGLASQADLIDGYEDGTFRPNDPISREQMAVMAARAIAFAGTAPQANETAVQRFADHADIADWAREPAAQLLKSEIVQGVTDMTFAPKDAVTRAQCAAVLNRMLRHLQFIN